MDQTIEQRLEALEAAFKRKCGDDADAIDAIWKAINQTNARITFLEFVLMSQLSNRLRNDPLKDSEKYKDALLEDFHSQIMSYILDRNVMGGNEQRQAEFVDFCRSIAEKFIADVRETENILRGKPQ